MKIACIALGCPKNQVDLDVMVHILLSAGHETVADLGEADVIPVSYTHLDVYKRQGQQPASCASFLSARCRRDQRQDRRRGSRVLQDRKRVV